MNVPKYILLLLALVAIASCTKEIKVKTPDVKEGLTLFSNTETGKEMYVVVGKSMSILKYNGKQELYVADATVKLFVDGAYLETLRYQRDLQMYYTTAIIEAGKHYKITAEAADYTSVEAEAEAPAQTPFTYLHVSDTTLPSQQGGGYTDATAVTFKFDDAATSADYYQLNFYSSDQVMRNDYSFSYECLNINDPSIDQHLDVLNGENCISGDISFSDDLFNGRAKQITASVSPYAAFPLEVSSGDSAYAIFKLTHLSEARYKYLISYKKAQDADGNPFAEPVNVYSNVKNGYGIFSISSPVILAIKK